LREFYGEDASKRTDENSDHPNADAHGEDGWQAD
jgi:hypothetical protein